MEFSEQSLPTTNKYSMNVANGSTSNSVESVVTEASVATEASSSPLVKTDAVTAASNGEKGDLFKYYITLKSDHETSRDPILL